MNECMYKDRCTDFNKRCGTCADNPSRSYYVPRYPIYQPISVEPWPYYPTTPPTIPPWPQIWCTVASSINPAFTVTHNTSSNTESHYKGPE